MPGSDGTVELADLTVERDARGLDGVVLVTLSREDRRNAMSTEMTASWGQAIADIAADRSVRCVIVTGAGRAFCAGGDLDWIGASPQASVDDLRSRMLAFYRTWLSIRQLEVPTIAAVNGAAVGAGLAVALACDLRYVAEEARLSAPFTSLGLHPGMATSWLLQEAAGLTVAKEMLLTGRVVRGAEAATSGLMTRSVPTEAVLDVAFESAAAVAAAAPVATRLTKAGLSDSGPGSFEAAIAWEAVAQPVTLATEDLQEGLLAAKERRTARFQGR